MSDTTTGGPIPPGPQCRWCGMYHGSLCPAVKSIEYQADGVTVHRVEFLTPKDRQVLYSGLPLMPGATYGPDH
jgi:hypothetical protein